MSNADVVASTQLHRGRELMLEHRCLHCHKTDEATLPELAMDAPAFKGIGSRRKPTWLAEWIANPKAHRQSARMPALFHDPNAAQDAEAIAEYLGTLTAAAESPTPRRDDATIASGSKLFASLNCAACHNPLDAAVSDETKLSFSHVARKFNPGALAAFLQEPTKHYKWIRMPNFRLSMEEVGLKLVSADGGFSCVSCHGIGKAGMNQVFESAGINLATSYERLQRDYLTRWMLNPLLVDPASKMPVFFDKEARSPLFEIYDGDGRKQIEALWQYVRPGKELLIPEGMEARAASESAGFEGLE